MNKNITILLLLLILSKSLLAQTDSTRNPEYYFRIVDSMELQQMKKAGIINHKDSIVEKYLDKEAEGLNDIGFEKYVEIKVEIYKQFYNDYLLLQSITYKNDVYVLYFSLAGFDDVLFQIIRWNKNNWHGSERLSKNLLQEPNQAFQKIAFNYDEGPKNLGNVRIFVKNDYLVMERGSLFHSLYDLRTNKLLLNEESPWHAAQPENLEEMNKWIKSNLHLKIEKIIDTGR